MEHLFMNNVIETGEEVIGKVKDIIEYFKYEMIKQVKEIDIFGDYIECNDIEDKQNNINLLLEFVNGLYQDYITEILESDTIIKVCFNPMGAYQYVIEEEMN